MKNQFFENSTKLESMFSTLGSPEAKYKKIIELGQSMPAFSDDKRIEENRVPGCQSILYIDCEISDGKLQFAAWSDALISKGLAAIAVIAFNGLTPNEMLTASMEVFQKIGIISSLSPTRANGFANLLVKMKQKTISFIN